MPSRKCIKFGCLNLYQPLPRSIEKRKGDRTTSSMDRLTQPLQSGGFSIKNLYHMLSPKHRRIPWKSMTLQPNLHSRFQFDLWLAARGRLATEIRLLKFGIQVPHTCDFYGLYDELFEHLFFCLSLCEGITVHITSLARSPQTYL